MAPSERSSRRRSQERFTLWPPSVSSVCGADEKWRLFVLTATAASFPKMAWGRAPSTSTWKIESGRSRVLAIGSKRHDVCARKIRIPKKPSDRAPSAAMKLVETTLRGPIMRPLEVDMDGAVHHQHRDTRVLFVCTANQHRSSTAARLFAGVPGLACYSAGTCVDRSRAGGAGHQLAQADLDRASLVFVMEPHHRDHIRRRFGRQHARKAIVLEVEDIYDFASPDLVNELLRKVPQHLSVPVDVARLRSSFPVRFSSVCW